MYRIRSGPFLKY